MKSIISRLTMKMYWMYVFIDPVTNKWVHKYVDIYGVKWLASSKYGYRIKSLKQ